jgi:hypothetical protein
MDQPACEGEQDKGNQPGETEQMGEFLVEEMGVHRRDVFRRPERRVARQQSA